jgi:acetylornithine deacetylase/succinyl-diaminopimelate desuccinylase-like protein
LGGKNLKIVNEFLKKLGCSLTTGGEKSRPALLARCGDGAEKGVMFSGHLDTVPVGTGWTKEQGEVERSIMYGRGTSDMKGGCAAILLAAERLSSEGIPFSIIFTTDEETTMKGAEAMAESVKESRVVIIGEPTDFDVVFREKGVYQFSITTKGVSFK